jgi:hypothetical protein
MRLIDNWLRKRSAVAFLEDQRARGLLKDETFEAICSSLAVAGQFTGNLVKAYEMYLGKQVDSKRFNQWLENDTIGKWWKATWVVMRKGKLDTPYLPVPGSIGGAMPGKLYGDKNAAYSEPAASYRSCMDRLLSTHQISLEGPPNVDVLIREVGTVSKWIALEGMRRSGRVSDPPTGADQVLGMLITLVAADHISRLASAPLEECGMLGCYALSRDLTGNIQEIVHSILDDATRLHNGMASKHPELLDSIGNSVAAFFSSNSDVHLDHIGGSFVDLLGLAGRPSQRD